MALGYFVEVNNSKWSVVSKICLVLGGVIFVTGAVLFEYKTFNRGLFLFTGLGLIVAYSIIRLIIGSTKRKGKFYLLPDQIIIMEPMKKSLVFNSKDVLRFSIELGTFEAQVGIRGAVSHFHPVSEEGNDNYIKFSTLENDYSYRIQIMNAAMFSKFEEIHKCWI